MQSNMHRDVNHVKRKEIYRNKKGDKLSKVHGAIMLYRTQMPIKQVKCGLEHEKTENKSNKAPRHKIQHHY